jgi:transposase
LHIAKHCDCWSDILVHPPARAYLEREQAQGKSRREAIRCLKRQLARVVFNTIKASPA